MELHGKKAIVTGAGGAIGAAVSASLAKQGAQLILIDRDEGALARVAERIEGETSTITLDLSNAEDIALTIERIVSEHDHIDILVNNAGVLSNNKLRSTTLQEWRDTHAVNVDAALLLIQGFVPGMVANKWGRIINMSSYAAKSGGLTAGTAYSVSKSALIGLTFSVARETTGDGVTANAIAPAYVMSPMVSEQLSEAQRQALLEEIPVGRFCDPEEVAHTVAFLASPLAGFITGEVIDMNGGFHFD